MIIRQANPNDKAQITTLVASVIEEFELPSNVQFVVRDLDTVFSLQASHQSDCWVAEVNQSIVGSISILPSSSLGECMLKRFYVAQPHRRQGLGSQLYAIAEEFARTVGYQRIMLEVSRKSPTAVLFYQHRDYQWVQDIDNAWEDTIYTKHLHH